MKKSILQQSCLGLLAIATIQAEIDPVQEAIRKFESSRNKKPAEVTVVLEPPAEAPAPITKPENPEPEAAETVESPEPTAPAVPAAPTAPVEPTAPSPPPPAPLPADATTKQPTGVSVSVRKSESGGLPSDSSTPKIHAPFPAKPLAKPPVGWLIEPSANIPAYSREVELEPGKTITLSVTPHILVPEADGYASFIVPEPGYNPALEYQQNATIGAVLAGSLRQLDADSKQLGLALDQLQQLLISLPKPKAQPVSPEETEPPAQEP